MMTAEQEKCEYCTFKGDYGKSFIVDLGFAEEELTIATHCHNRYWLYIVVNDYCPMCGRRLRND